MNNITSEPSSVIHYKFLILPGFSLVPYATAIDVIRLANRISGKTLYSWQTLTPTGDVVYASTGLAIAPDQIFSGTETCDILFVCGGAKIQDAWSDSIGTRLKMMQSRNIDLGALCTGTYILAMANLLDGYRSTIHWKKLSSTREKFPKLDLTGDIYEIDRNRYTCAGGIAAIDMMFHLICLKYDRELAVSVMDSILVERVRNMTEAQYIPLRHKIGNGQPKLISAVKLMETNIEEPLSPNEIAELVKISRRQLERLFSKHFDTTPTRYYLDLRLRNAQRLLLQTGLTVIEISLICGFSSAPHFSKCYRDLFNRSPSEERGLILKPLD